MGDNRGASSDSRYWGPVSEDLLIGKAFLRLLPLKNIDLMPGAYTQTNESTKEMMEMCPACRQIKNAELLQGGNSYER